MRVFVNNVDGYVGRALCADLRAVLGQDNRLIGTLMVESDEDKSELLRSLGVKRLVSRAKRQKYLEDILSCSLVVFDLHSADPSEVETVVKHLKVAPLAHEVTFVLISSVNVWAKTKNARIPISNEEEEEEPVEDAEGGVQKIKDRPKELTDADLDRRIPTAAFETWKYLETLALSLTSKAKLRPHIVAAGILYGNGEQTFNDIFKASWLAQPTQSIVFPGDNYLPCVHVRDVARLVKAVHLREPAAEAAVGPYLIAVDRSRLTQADIVTGIVGHLSKTREVARVTADKVGAEMREAMTLDLIMEPSGPMRVSSFPWWCRDGLVANLEKVAAEFCKWRNLRPIKVVVLGPPGAGAEGLCARIAERYLHAEPPHFTFDQIVSDACAAGTASAERLKRKVARLARKPGGQLPLNVRTKLVQKRLSSNVCRYRGYVLEGYPRTYLEADALFMETVRAEGEEEPPEEEEEEAEGGEDGEDQDQPDETPAPPADDEDEEDGDKPQRRVNAAIAPEFAVTLRSSPDRCKARIFAGEARGPACEEEFLARTAEYHRGNLTQDGSLCTGDFFSETAGGHVLEVDVDGTSHEEAFQAIRVHMESRGQFFNYLRSEEERCRERAAQLLFEEQQADERAEAARQESLAEEDRLCAKQAADEVQRKRDIAEGEATLLETETTPLRQYLMVNVVPTLTEGLSEVCREQPEDPIEFLAKYLFAHAHEASGSLQ